MWAAKSGSALILVLGFAPAGIGASFFRPAHRSGVPVRGIDLPGRESRAGERACGHLYCAVDDATNQVNRAVTAHSGTMSGLTLIGHSFGAVVAWQVAVRLAETDRLPKYTNLVVSGAPSPSRRRIPLAHLPDDALVAAVARLTGHDHPAYHDPKLRSVLLPALRSDLACLVEVPLPERNLNIPVHLIRGSDDPVLGPRDIEGWRATSRGPLQEHVVRGGHMHPVEHPDTYAAVVLTAVADLDSASTATTV